MKEIGKEDLGTLLCEDKGCEMNKGDFTGFSVLTLRGAAEKHEVQTGHNTVVVLDSPKPLKRDEVEQVLKLTGFNLGIS